MAEKQVKEIIDQLREFAEEMKEDGDDYVRDWGRKLELLLNKIEK